MAVQKEQHLSLASSANEIAKAAPAVITPDLITLVSRQYKAVCFISLGLYGSFLYIAYYVQHIRQCKLCDSDQLSLLTRMIQVFSCGASFNSGFNFLLKLYYKYSTFKDDEANEFGACLTLLTMAFINASSQFISIADTTSHSCMDAFGMKTPLFQWIEWSITVPLMFYCSIALDTSKKQLQLIDYTIILLGFIGISSAFFAFVGESFTTNIQLLCVSIISFGVSLVSLIVIAYKQYCLSLKLHETLDNKRKNSKERLISSIISLSSRNFLYCSIYLGISFPLFPLFYFLGAFKVIDSDIATSIIVLLGYIVKMIYISIIMEIHIKISDSTVSKLQVQHGINDARRIFLRYVFHEVRVPLNSISMGVNVLYDSETLSRDERDTLDMMKEATLFMTETLNDVLSLQKIEEGKLELQMSSCSLAAIIKAVVTTQTGSVSAKKINLVTVLPTELPNTVIADRFRLEHVIANFLSNAVKFSPTGSKITIQASIINAKSDKNTQSIKIGVIDQGIGINDVDQKMLFCPYVQFDPSFQKGAGTGIGLSICRETILLHGGTVDVKSEVGKGSEFSFTIPYEIAIEDTTTGSAADSDKTDGELDDHNPLIPSRPVHFLVVDDQLSNRKMLSKLLVSKGAVISEACNGADAVALVAEDLKKFNIIIMDNMMPIMDGINASKNIRSLGYEGLICGLTGCGLDEDVIEFEDAGCDTVLLKPVKLATLTNIFKHIATHGPKSIINADPDSRAYKSMKGITLEISK